MCSGRRAESERSVDVGARAVTPRIVGKSVVYGARFGLRAGGVVVGAGRNGLARDPLPRVRVRASLRSASRKRRTGTVRSSRTASSGGEPHRAQALLAEARPGASGQPDLVEVPAVRIGAPAAVVPADVGVGRVIEQAVRSRPTSSATSRTAAAAGSSPASTCPAGIGHLVGEEPALERQAGPLGSTTTTRRFVPVLAVGVDPPPHAAGRTSQRRPPSAPCHARSRAVAHARAEHARSPALGARRRTPSGSRAARSTPRPASEGAGR